MSVKCKILLVLLNLFYSINGDTDKALFTSDWTMDQTLTNKDPARQLQSQNIKIEVKQKTVFSSTRYWKESSSTNKVITQNKIKTTAKKKGNTPSNEITTTSRKNKSTAPNTKITTTRKNKTATAHEITSAATENKIRTSAKKKGTATSNEITTTPKENKTSAPNTKITTKKKNKTATSDEITSTTIENKIRTTAKKKETATSNEITTTSRENKNTAPKTKIKKDKTATPDEINKIEEKKVSITKREVSSSTQDISSTPNLNVSTIEKDTSQVTTSTINKITTRKPAITTKKKKKKSNTTKKGDLNLNYVQAADDRMNKRTTLNPYDLKNDLLKVMSNFPNANATAEVIGRSVEYKDIVLLKITDANTEDKKIAREDKNKLEVENKSEEKIDTEINTDGKKIIFIVHGLSTFELWKIPCLYEEMQFKLLISFYLSHLKNFDIFLIPVANPDGFAKKDNLWNKNVSPQEDCGGVALDRNFDVAWNIRSNMSSCDQLYPGPEPFSEAESKAVKDVFLKYGKKMAAYIHVHATDNNFDYRGNTVLIPKGYTDEESDEDKYIDLKGEIDEAIRKANFDIVSVNVKTVYRWYGAVAGTSVDYASEVIKVPFAMEFLMQPYPTEVNDVKKDLNQAALTHIWKRMIDTVFNFIHKINNSDESD